MGYPMNLSVARSTQPCQTTLTRLSHSLCIKGDDTNALFYTNSEQPQVEALVTKLHLKGFHTRYAVQQIRNDTSLNS